MVIISLRNKIKKQIKNTKNVYNISNDVKLALSVISDIHLERLPDYFWEIKAPKELYTVKGRYIPNVLILAGDIGHPLESYFKIFLEDVAKKFDYVIMVTGNHEYYEQNGEHPNMEKVEQELRKICIEISGKENMGKCYYLQEDSIIINNIKFAGVTLWGNIPKEHAENISHRMGDFYEIHINNTPYQVKDQNRLNKNHVDFIKEEIKKLKLKENHEIDTIKGEENSVEYLVIISHHAPSWKMLEKKYMDDYMSYTFANNLDDLLKPPIKLWVNGHLHNTRLIESQWGTYVYSNALGKFPYSSKYRENRDYNPDTILLI